MLPDYNKFDVLARLEYLIVGMFVGAMLEYYFPTPNMNIIYGAFVLVAGLVHCVALDKLAKGERGE